MEETTPVSTDVCFEEERKPSMVSVLWGLFQVE